MESILRTAPAVADAPAAWQAWHVGGLRLHSLQDKAAWPTPKPPLIIDGLFGIGLARALPAPLTPLIAWVKRSRAPVLAIDVPIGIDADTGAAVAGGAVLPATVTVTMIGDKPGLHTGNGLAAAGEVLVAPLMTAATICRIRSHRIVWISPISFAQAIRSLIMSFCADAAAPVARPAPGLP